jgi:hypothetical protein
MSDPQSASQVLGSVGDGSLIGLSLAFCVLTVLRDAWPICKGQKSASDAMTASAGLQAPPRVVSEVAVEPTPPQFSRPAVQDRASRCRTR